MNRMKGYSKKSRTKDNRMAGYQKPYVKKARKKGKEVGPGRAYKTA